MSNFHRLPERYTQLEPSGQYEVQSRIKMDLRNLELRLCNNFHKSLCTYDLHLPTWVQRLLRFHYLLLRSCNSYTTNYSITGNKSLKQYQVHKRVQCSTYNKHAQDSIPNEASSSTDDQIVWHVDFQRNLCPCQSFGRKLK